MIATERTKTTGRMKLSIYALEFLSSHPNGSSITHTRPNSPLPIAINFGLNASSSSSVSRQHKTAQRDPIHNIPKRIASMTISLAASSTLLLTTVYSVVQGSFSGVGTVELSRSLQGMEIRVGARLIEDVEGESL